MGELSWPGPSSLYTMHFAFPPRKTSQPPPYAHRGTSYSTHLRRSRVKSLAILAVSVTAVFYLLSKLFGGSGHVQVGDPTEAVIVTVLQPELYSKEYIENIKQNRIQYAKRHGMRTNCNDKENDLLT